MTNIDPRMECVTLINTFTVVPERQEELIKTVVEFNQRAARYLDGFISASVHRGVEGDRVATYAQWVSIEHFHEALKTPVANEHMKRIAQLADKIDPVLYEVEASIDRSESKKLFGPEARI